MHPFQLQEVDIAVGPFTITPERSQVVDFTVPYMEDGGGILTKKGEANPDLLNVFRPLSPFVWAAVVGAVVITVLVLYFINNIAAFR